jgi:threonine synthase
MKQSKIMPIRAEILTRFSRYYESAMGTPSGLRCSKCSRSFGTNQLLNLCECGGPLLVEYDLTAIGEIWKRDSLKNPGTPSSMWRYVPVMPLDFAEATSLSEGWTPLSHARALGSVMGADRLFIKDEGRNPTHTFKARGLCCAVSMARKLGAKKLAIPSAGNAAGALAAYAAAAGLEAHIVMPDDVPQSNYLESMAYGAHVTLINGLISDCGRIVAERKNQAGWFEVSTLKEPYRIEGKKTMGYELAEQFNWTLPDAILYPCGGGVGLIGMWKAFAELETLAWIDAKRPKMIAVQATGCAPITRAVEAGQTTSQFWANAYTVCSGLRVPKALGDFLVLQAIRESGGTALSVTDEESIDGALELARLEGIFAAPEGGACVAAARRLYQTGFLKPHETVLICNTGSGAKYAEAYATRFFRSNSAEQDKLGGLILPR